MIGDEPDRHDHDGADSPFVQGVDVVDDVGFEPRHLWRTGPRLPHQVVVVLAERLGHQPRRFGHLPAVEMPTLLRRTTGRVEGVRNGVRGEHHARGIAHVVGEFDAGGAHGVGDGVEEQRVVVEVPQLRQLRGVLDGVPCPRDVLVVLPASRVAAPGGGREHQALRIPSSRIRATVSSTMGCQLRLPK